MLSKALLSLAVNEIIAIPLKVKGEEEVGSSEVELTDKSTKAERVQRRIIAVKRETREGLFIAYISWCPETTNLQSILETDPMIGFRVLS